MKIIYVISRIKDFEYWECKLNKSLRCMNISEISQRYIGIYLVKGRKNMHQEMSNSTTKESFGEEIKYRASHLNSGIT